MMHNCCSKMLAFALLMLGSVSLTQAQLEFGRLGPVEVPPDGYTLIQIEDGTPGDEPLDGLELRLDSSLKSGIKAVSLVDGRDFPEFPLSHEIQIPINIQQAGTYYLFAKVNAFNGSSDSFFVGMDGNVANSNDFRFNIDARNAFAREWVTSESTDNAVVPFELTAGEHIINWHAREPDAEVDWIGITDNPDLDLNQIEEPGAGVVIARRSASTFLVEGGEAFDVILTLSNSGDGAKTVSVTETPPADFTIGAISNNGSASDGTIAWSNIQVPGNGSVELTYTLTAPASISGVIEFSGTAGDFPIVGASSLAVPQDIGIFEANLDIGDPSVPGTASSSGDSTFSVEGDGGGIGGAADSFHFLFREVTGSFSLQATIFNFPIDGAEAEAGLMVRDGLDPGAAMFGAFVGAGDDLIDAFSVARLNAGESAFQSGNLADQLGELEIVRFGSQVSMYFISTQTGERTLFTSQNIAISNPVLVGLAVTGNNDGELAGGDFENVQFTPIPFAVERSLPGQEFTPEQPITVSITTTVPEGETANVDIEEVVPNGWTVSNVNASNGSASESDGIITWSLSGASGTPTLTYDVTPPAGASIGEWSGTASGAGFDLPIAGPNRMQSVSAITVYFIGEQGRDDAEDGIYLNLLEAGHTLLDDNGNEVFIPGLGFVATVVSGAEDSAAAALNGGFDLVFSVESLSSGDSDRYIDIPIPYASMEQVLVAGRADRDGSLFLSTQDAVNLGGGEQEMTIIDNTHPITSFWEQDQVIQVTRRQGPELAGVTPDGIAPGATALASAQGPERFTVIVMDEGQEGLIGNADATIPDGAEPTPARRGWMGFHENVPEFEDGVPPTPENTALTFDGAIMFQRFVQWLVGVPVTADGTEEGVPVEEWMLY